MDKTIQDNLCYRFSSQGLPQSLVHNLLNKIQKWVSLSGKLWTVDRLKELHNYYKEYCAFEGDMKDFLLIKKPPYLAVRRDGLPKGPFKSIFRMKDAKKALVVLSCHADFVEKQLTKQQYQKFLKGISSETDINTDVFIKFCCNKKFNFRYFRSTVKRPAHTGYFSSLKKIGLRFVSEDLNSVISSEPNLSGIVLVDQETSQKFSWRPTNSIKYQTFCLNHLTSEKTLDSGESRLNLWNSSLDSSFRPIPGYEIITTKSIPVLTDGYRNYRVKDKRDIAVAYAYSWYSVPKLTLDYVGDAWDWAHIPDGLIKDYIYELTYDDGLSLTPEQRANQCGTIGIIQEKSCKARIVANPNKITQFFLKPFGRKLYQMLHSVPTDCTFDQDAGAQWCQAKLSDNISLSAVDLSSATDTLSVVCSLQLIELFFFGTFPGTEVNLTKEWILARNHFLKLCKEGKWSVLDHNKKENFVTYKQGQPMGTYPSFAILGLTNNIVATMAAIEAGLDPTDSFRVVGDDIVMLTEMQNNYISIITAIGGQVNTSKTLVSRKLTEFTGGIISKTRNLRKTTKTLNIDDNSFVSKAKSFGVKVVKFFKPKQRRVFEKKAMYIPGIAIDGPWLEDSFGVPLKLRIDYAFALSDALNSRVEPDKDFMDKDQFLLYLYYSLAEKDRLDLYVYAAPNLMYSDFQSEMLLSLASYHVDQIEKGTTLLESLSKKDLINFKDFCLDTFRKSISDNDVFKDLNKNIGSKIANNIIENCLPNWDADEASTSLQKFKEFRNSIGDSILLSAENVIQTLQQCSSSESLKASLKELLEDKVTSYILSTYGKGSLSTLNHSFCSELYESACLSLFAKASNGNEYSDVSALVNQCYKTVAEILSPSFGKEDDSKGLSIKLVLLGMGLTLIGLAGIPDLGKRLGPNITTNVGTLWIKNQAKSMLKNQDVILYAFDKLIVTFPYLRNFKWSRDLIPPTVLSGSFRKNCKVSESEASLLMRSSSHDDHKLKLGRKHQEDKSSMKYDNQILAQ